MIDHLPKTFHDIRTAAGDSPATAAKKVGVSRQAYNKWEQGDTKNMKLANLLAFCDKYKIRIEDLLRQDAEYEKAADILMPAKLHVAEPNPDIKLLIDGFSVADTGLRRAMLAIARESLAAFEKRSEQND